MLLFDLKAGLCLDGSYCLMFVGVGILGELGVVRCGFGLGGWLEGLLFIWFVWGRSFERWDWVVGNAWGSICLLWYLVGSGSWRCLCISIVCCGVLCIGALK